MVQMALKEYSPALRRAMNKGLEKKKTIESLVEQEKMGRKHWNELTEKYNTFGLTKNQLKVVEAGKVFYDSLRNKLTKGGDQELAMARIINYDVYSFPYSMNNMNQVLAWIDVVGDNQLELENLFPFYFNRCMNKDYLFRTPNDTSNVEATDFKPVLTVLSYLIHCEEWTGNGLFSVRTKKPGRNTDGYIRANTALFNIEIKFDGTLETPYYYICISLNTNLENMKMIS